MPGSGTTVNPFRYVGQFGYYRDIAIRQYVRARHLDVGKGKWISQDPIGFLGGINLYGYVGNEPVGWVDPSGEIFPLLLWLLFGFAIGVVGDAVEQYYKKGRNFQKIDVGEELIVGAFAGLTSAAAEFWSGIFAAIGSVPARFGLNAIFNCTTDCLFTTAGTSMMNMHTGRDSDLTQAAMWGAGFGLLGPFGGAVGGPPETITATELRILKPFPNASIPLSKGSVIGRLAAGTGARVRAGFTRPAANPRRRRML